MSTNYKIGVDIAERGAAKAASGLRLVDNSLNSIGRSAQFFSVGLSGAGSAYGAFTSSLTSGNAAVIAAAAAVGGLGVVVNQSNEALQRASSFDSARRGLTAVSGSAELASSKIVELEQVAKNTQGLKFRDAIQGQRNLEAAGIEAGEATRELRVFANVMAVVGGSGAEFDGVLLALRQVASKSQISAEEINQLAERIPQIREAMKAVYGTSDTEILQKRGIDPKEFLEKITTELEKVPRATGSAAGGWENLTDAVDKAYIKVGEPALPAATRILDKFTNLIENNTSTLDSWSQKLVRTLNVIEDLTDVVDYLSQTSLATLVGWIDDVAASLNTIQPLIDLIALVSADISKYTDAQKAATDQTKKSGEAQKSATEQAKNAAREQVKTAKESYDARILQIDEFYRSTKNRLTEGVRQNKTQELGYQQQLLNLEKQNYNQRLDALGAFYREKLKKAKTQAEAESILNQAQTEVTKNKVEFGDTKSKIQGSINELGAAVKEQLRNDLNEGLQIALDGATTTLGNTLDDLAEQFDTGAIHAVKYWESAKEALNGYAKEVIKIRKEQLNLTFKNPALTPGQRTNETDRAIQQNKDSERQITEKGKQIRKFLTDFQATNDRTISDHFLETQSNIEEATTSLLEYYRLLKQQPDVTANPLSDKGESFSDFAKDVAKEYDGFIKSTANSEEELLKRSQGVAEDVFIRKIGFLQNELKYYANNATKKAEIERELEKNNTQLVALQAKNATDLYKFKIDKAEEYRQAALQINSELLNAEQQAAQAQINLNRTILDTATVKPGGNLALVNAQAKSDRERLLKAKEFEIKRLEAEQKAALKSIENVKNKTELEEKINKTFRDKDTALEAEYQAELLRIEKEYKERRLNAKRQDRVDKDPFGQTVVNGIRDEVGVGGIGVAIEDATTRAEASAAATKEVYKDLGATVVDVFGQIASATQNMLENFILTGEGGAAVFAQLAASIIASLAVQSGVKAIFEVAEGFAAAARYDFVAAAGHFTAAKIYGAVAIGAAAVGIGIGLAGGLQGGKGKGGKSQSDQPDYTVAKSSANANTNNDQNVVQANGKVGADPVTTKLVNLLEAKMESDEAFYNKIKTSKAGDLLVVGANQNPGFLANRTISELKRDSSKVKEMGNALNMK